MTAGKWRLGFPGRLLERSLGGVTHAGPAAAPDSGDVADRGSDWTKAEVRALAVLPFGELMLQAQLTHRSNHDPQDNEIATLARSLAHRASGKDGSSVLAGAVVEMRGARDSRIGTLHRLACVDPPCRDLRVTLGSGSAAGLAGSREDGGFDGLELVRTVAVARILMPSSLIRVDSARCRLSETLVALCFLAGANLVFCGECEPPVQRRRNGTILGRLLARKTGRGRRT
jgi:hypothetical protein